MVLPTSSPHRVGLLPWDLLDQKSPRYSPGCRGVGVGGGVVTDD